MPKKEKMKGKKVRGRLDAPVDLTASIVDGVLNGGWAAVEGATKYSFAVEVGYDLDGDGEAEASEEFDYSAVETMVVVPVADLSMVVESEEGTVTVAPMSISVKVKGMNPPQQGLFSVPVVVL